MGSAIRSTESMGEHWNESPSSRPPAVGQTPAAEEGQVGALVLRRAECGESWGRVRCGRMG